MRLLHDTSARTCQGSPSTSVHRELFELDLRHCKCKRLMPGFVRQVPDVTHPEHTPITLARLAQALCLDVIPSVPVCTYISHDHSYCGVDPDRQPYP